jgi:hypothetical protein
MSPSSLSRRAVAVGIAATLSAAVARPARADRPSVKVVKDPNCGCCNDWVEHLRTSGFSVTVEDTAQLNRIKARLGVPRDLSSCHTAEVGGYVVEGHVPASAIRRLLAERPNARGLAVPGMPVGSPGMEVPGTPPDTYDVVLFGPSGRRVFARFSGVEELPGSAPVR